MLLICLKGLENLKKLKILSLQSNRITKLEGLEELKVLDQLYLSHNGVEKLEGLENNVSCYSNSCALVLIACFSSSLPLLMSETTLSLPSRT